MYLQYLEVNITFIFLNKIKYTFFWNNSEIIRWKINTFSNSHSFKIIPYLNWVHYHLEFYWWCYISNTYINGNLLLSYDINLMWLKNLEIVPLWRQNVRFIIAARSRSGPKICFSNTNTYLILIKTVIIKNVKCNLIRKDLINIPKTCWLN